jgi:phosphatidylserine/phosphatidylglycerophosphate/cardiolipin synthase-like enzyme
MQATSTLVFGDSQSNIYVVDVANGIVSTAVLPFVSFSAAPLIFNAVAYCPTSGGFLYPVNIGPLQVSSSAVQFGAQINSTPIPVGRYIVAATADGNLNAIDISGSSPSVVWSATFLTVGAHPSAVGWLAIAPCPPSAGTPGFLVLVATAAGMFGASIRADCGTASPVWSSQLGTSFLGAKPLLAGTRLFATSGNTLYSWDLTVSPDSSNNLAPVSTWSAGTGRILYQPWAVSADLIVVGDDQGSYHILPFAGCAAPPALPGLAGGAALASFADGVIYEATASGSIAASQLDFDQGIPQLSRKWSAACPVALAGSPVLAFALTPSYAGYVLHVPGSDGKLYRFDKDGNSLTTVPVTSSGSLTGVTAASTSLSSNALGATAFVLDGSNYFATLRNLLMCVREGSLSPSTAMPATPNVVTMLSHAAGKGSQIRVIGWTPGHTSELAILAMAKAGLDLQTDVKSTRTAVNLLNSIPNIQAFAEVYQTSRWTPSAWTESQHQKIAVFSIAGTRFALVGGFNLKTPEYFDTPAHPMPDPNSLHALHDTALLLQGPVVDLVESEFDRRWAKRIGGHEKPTSASYAKLAYWGISLSGCLDNEEVCSMGASPTPFVTPATSRSTVGLSVLVTNSEERPITQIRDALLQYISQATRYIYFENQGFADGQLVSALVRQLIGVPALQLIVMVPAQWRRSDGTLELNTYYALTSVAMAAIHLQIQWTTLTYRTATGGSSTISNSQPVSVFVNPNDIYSSYCVCGGITIYLYNITAITGTSPRIMFSCPARYFATAPATPLKTIPGYKDNYRAIYIHSKLALFDDRVVLLGSANFTTRSLMSDGEMSVAVNDAPTAAAIAATLFPHWNASGASGWQAAMSAFASTSSDGIGPLSISLAQLLNEPIPWRDWILASLES